MVDCYTLLKTAAREESHKAHEAEPDINIENDSRVSILIWKNDDPFKYVEVRGNVEDSYKGKEARDHIDKLSEKYFKRPYPFTVQTERVVLKIKAAKFSD